MKIIRHSFTDRITWWSYVPDFFPRYSWLVAISTSSCAIAVVGYLVFTIGPIKLARVVEQQYSELAVDSIAIAVADNELIKWNENDWSYKY